MTATLPNGDNQHTASRVVLLTDGFELWVGQGVVVPGAGLSPRRNDQAVGLGHVEPAQRDAVEQGEDGAGGADAERERRDGEHREHRAAAKHADGIAHVLEPGLQPGARLGVVDVFFQRLDPPELDHAGPPRFIRAQPCPAMLILDRVEGPAQLLVELALDGASVHQVAPEAAKARETSHVSPFSA